MTLERLKGEIIASARAKAKQILDQARKEAKAIIAKTEQDFVPAREKIEAETKAMRDAVIAREKSKANLEAKKLAFEEKKRLIDEVFDAAEKQLVSAPADKRQALIAKYLEKAKKEIDIARVFVNKNDLRLVKGLETFEAAIKGGLVAENADGTHRVDYSIETLLSEFREKELQKVVKMLTR